jgi:hypothetical protein
MTRRKRKPNRRRQCEGKRQFDTLQEAEQQIWTLIRLKQAVYGTMSAYQCKVCSKFHIGHRAGRLRRMRGGE